MQFGDLARMDPGSDYEALACDFSCKAKPDDFTDYDYSDDLKLLFASPAG